jgi:hypothetical protein
VFAFYLRGMPFSISAGVGFIALFVILKIVAAFCRPKHCLGMVCACAV